MNTLETLKSPFGQPFYSCNERMLRYRNFEKRKPFGKTLPLLLQSEKLCLSKCPKLSREEERKAEIEKAYIAFVVGSESLSLNVCRCAMPS